MNFCRKLWHINIWIPYVQGGTTVKCSRGKSMFSDFGNFFLIDNWKHENLKTYFFHENISLLTFPWIWYKNTDTCGVQCSLKIIDNKSLSTVKCVYFLLQIWDGWDVSPCTARSMPEPKYCAAKKNDSNFQLLFLQIQYVFKSVFLLPQHISTCSPCVAFLAEFVVWTSHPWEYRKHNSVNDSSLYFVPRRVWTTVPIVLFCLYCVPRLYPDAIQAALSLWRSHLLFSLYRLNLLFCARTCKFFLRPFRCTVLRVQIFTSSNKNRTTQSFWKHENVPANVWFAPLRIAVISFPFLSARNTYEANETQKKIFLPDAMWNDYPVAYSLQRIATGMP